MYTIIKKCNIFSWYKAFFPMTGFFSDEVFRDFFLDLVYDWCRVGHRVVCLEFYEFK